MSRPPPQPLYILRGHAVQVHSATFVRSNSRLVTGDADGWIVVWSLVTRRAVAVWRAHQAAVLASSAWRDDRLITHGKDNQLVVWKFTEDDELSMSSALPIDGSDIYRRPPWLLHILQVNTLNFCSFASCGVRRGRRVAGTDLRVNAGEVEELLVAVPNAITSENVDIFHLPSERRIDTVGGYPSVKMGMVMAVSIFYRNSALTLVTGYESGHTMVSQQVDGQRWHVLYMSQPHTQPILSLDVLPNQSSYLTSSADAIIAKHAIPDATTPRADLSSASSSPATAGNDPINGRASLLSLGIADAAPARTSTSSSPNANMQTTPLKLAQTKHSGQQCLKVRSDGKILATAGWDARVRVYSTQSLKELAVLKWHKEGCYAVAFAEMMKPDAAEDDGRAEADVPSGKQLEKAMTTPITGLTRSVYEKRASQAISTHWLAAGSKDGKVSLWDIY